MSRYETGIIFDLDGVLTDTAELHYQSWKWLTDELGIPFDRQANEALRGLNREHSLALILGDRDNAYTDDQKRELTQRKNADYVRRVSRMTPADLFPGTRELLEDLRARGVGTAVASSSRNATAVIDQLQIRSLLDVLLDGNDAPRSKPDPQVFELAAARLGLPPERCVVVEDAASGIEAALAAGMPVVGIGPAERVGRAHRMVTRTGELTVELLLSLLPS